MVFKIRGLNTIAETPLFSSKSGPDLHVIWASISVEEAATGTGDIHVTFRWWDGGPAQSSVILSCGGTGVGNPGTTSIITPISHPSSLTYEVTKDGTLVGNVRFVLEVHVARLPTEREAGTIRVAVTAHYPSGG